MAIRKLSDLYFPYYYRLMLDNGSWYTYDTRSFCPNDKVDRRLAMKMIRDGLVENKTIDVFGRIMYSRAYHKAAHERMTR